GFYSWGNHSCCLGKGATSATLIDTWVEPPPTPPTDPTRPAAPALEAPKAPATKTRTWSLSVGDVLIFEEVTGPKTGDPADADPRHRQAVRLTSVTQAVDPLNDQPVVEIAW